MTERLSAEERTLLDPAETHAFPLPIPVQIVSNGEFLSAPQGELQKRFEARLKERADALARKRGLSSPGARCWAPPRAWRRPFSR
jgi:hypothetical protein